MKTQRQELQRILLVRNDRIGDLVLTLPAIEAMRRGYPQAHVAVLASQYAAPLLAGSRSIDELMVDRPSDTPWQLGRRLAQLRFDAALVFNSTTRNCLAVRFAGIKTRVCWAYKAAGFLCGNRRVALHRSHPPVHEAEFALSFVRRLGLEARLDRLAPRLDIDPLSLARVSQRVQADLGNEGPLFGIHPGNKNSAYNWPLARYTELANRLAEIGRVMVTGGPEEAGLLETLRAGLNDAARRRVAFYNAFSLAELTAAISLQTALTVSSTGPMHIAGVLDTPVVALFSPHPAHVPEKWAPLGRRQTLLVAPLALGENPRVPRELGAELMARIDVEAAYRANLHYAQADLATRTHKKFPPEQAA